MLIDTLDKQWEKEHPELHQTMLPVLAILRASNEAEQSKYQYLADKLDKQEKDFQKFKKVFMQDVKQDSTDLTVRAQSDTSEHEWAALDTVMGRQPWDMHMEVKKSRMRAPKGMSMWKIEMTDRRK